MMKLTKRKAFNFFRSYYDVYNELSNKDKVQFMDALLDRQFLGTKPEDLKGMAKFAYISQTNSIDSQVKGYETKHEALSKVELPPTEAPTDGGNTPPIPQVEEKGKEKEQVQELLKDLCDFFSVNEMKNVNTFKAIHTFVRLSGIDAKTFNAYKEYKKTSKEKIHGWPAFIGSVEKQFADGMWASLDWAKQIKDIPQQSNGIPSAPDLTWIATKGKDIQLYQKACKIWKGNGWEFIQPPGSTKRVWREIKE